MLLLKYTAKLQICKLNIWIYRDFFRKFREIRGDTQFFGHKQWFLADCRERIYFDLIGQSVSRKPE